VTVVLKLLNISTSISASSSISMSVADCQRALISNVTLPVEIHWSVRFMIVVGCISTLCRGRIGGCKAADMRSEYRHHVMIMISCMAVCAIIYDIIKNIIYDLKYVSWMISLMISYMIS
jgi:hypothetical protein